MIFKNIEEEALYYRSLTDYKLLPNSYVICMLDGRSFSSFTKRHFAKPFDADFHSMMNETAKYLCENISGCVLAYVQSDEITLILKDTQEQEPMFGYRLCKMLSVFASLATAKFNQLMMMYYMGHGMGINPTDVIEKTPLCQFDCKCWNVPNEQKVLQWLIYRQNDCVRNSKQQFAQTYLPHKELVGLKTDQQVDKVLNLKGMDWNQCTNGEKYGRYIYKESIIIQTQNGDIERSKFKIIDGKFLTVDKDFANKIMNIITFQTE